MSGHSKWSKIKHQKGTDDIKKGQTFTITSKLICLAVRQSGGNTDPETNFKLRLAIEKAHEINMPKDNILRAIDRGKGKTDDSKLEEVTYEGYGPFGIAFLIETATDNRLRTSSEIKNLLETNNGSLGVPGSVAFNFRSRGIIFVKNDQITADELLNKTIEAGAEDFTEANDSFIIYTPVDRIREVKDKLLASGVKIKTIDFVMEPLNYITIANKEETNKVTSLIQKLEELDDVISVHTNLKV